MEQTLSGGRVKQKSHSISNSFGERHRMNMVIQGIASTSQKLSPRKSRSRRGMKNLAAAFDSLRSHVPTYPPGKKLTKIETLRFAMLYIVDLQQILGEAECGSVTISADTALHGRVMKVPLCPPATCGRSSSLGMPSSLSGVVCPISAVSLSDNPVGTSRLSTSPGRQNDHFTKLVS